jgi:hypothetical protein
MAALPSVKQENYFPFSVIVKNGTMEPSGPEQLSEMIRRRSRNRAEEFMQKTRKRSSGSPDAPVNEAGAHHDSAIRNHLAGLVRAFLQSGDREKLRELLIEHRNFIDSILQLLDQKK